jgi:hypothetical protein
MNEERRCGVCGESLDGLRRGARYCSRACKQEAYRVRQLAAGRPVAPYETLNDRMAAYGRPRRSTRRIGVTEKASGG